MRGDVPVEHLVVGDLAVTAGGATRPITWLGSRTLDCTRHPRPAEIMPVRIAAGTFGEGRPARDLWLSPGHSVCLDILGEVLIPAIALVDGTAVAQVSVDTVIYWHVELDSHEVILAEGLPSESYLEMGNRTFFAEADIVALHASPDAQVKTHADFCRPFHDGGPVVDRRARRRPPAGYGQAGRGVANGLTPPIRPARDVAPVNPKRHSDRGASRRASARAAR